MVVRLGRGILKNSLSFTFNVFKLARPDRPGKYPNHREGQQNRDRYQQKEDVHQFPSGARASRAAFNNTNNELSAMPSPANQAGK